MAEDTCSTSQFHLFASLPPEIRGQIWYHALPSLHPAVHFYRNDCWATHHSSPADETDQPDLCIKFEHGRVRKTWFSVPMVHVNHEAQQIALLWARQYHLRFCFVQQIQDLVFIRRYNSQSDPLFIGSNTWEAFLMGYHDSEDPMFQNRAWTVSRDIDHIIILQSFLEQCVQSLKAIFLLNDLETLYISISEIESSEGVLDPSFQYRPIEGACRNWNIEHQRFDTEKGEETTKNVDQKLNKLLEEAAQNINEEFARFGREWEFSIIAVQPYRV